MANYRCPLCKKLMQKASIPRHNKKWCRGTFVLDNRKKDSEFARLHASHLPFAQEANLKIKRGLVAILGTHLDKHCSIQFGWYAHKWVPLFLNSTAGGKFSRKKRMKFLIEARDNEELRESLVAIKTLAGTAQLELFLEEYLGKKRSYGQVAAEPYPYEETAAKQG